MNIVDLLSIATILLLLLLLAAVIYIMWMSRVYFELTNKNVGELLQSQLLSLDNSIKNSVQSKFIELSPNTQNIKELGIEIWRLNKRLSKAKDSLSEDQNVAFQNSIAKLYRYLDKNDVKIVDYTNQKYNEGLNVDVFSITKDASITESIITETIEPAIMHKGQLIKQAKVVILEK